MREGWARAQAEHMLDLGLDWLPKDVEEAVTSGVIEEEEVPYFLL